MKRESYKKFLIKKYGKDLALDFLWGDEFRSSSVIKAFKTLRYNNLPQSKVNDILYGIWMGLNFLHTRYVSVPDQLIDQLYYWMELQNVSKSYGKLYETVLGKPTDLRGGDMIEPLVIDRWFFNKDFSNRKAEKYLKLVGFPYRSTSLDTWVYILEHLPQSLKVWEQLIDYIKKLSLDQDSECKAWIEVYDLIKSPLLLNNKGVLYKGKFIYYCHLYYHPDGIVSLSPYYKFEPITVDEFLSLPFLVEKPS